MKLKYFVRALICATALSSTFLFGAEAFASETSLINDSESGLVMEVVEYDDLPKHIQDKINDRVNNDKFNENLENYDYKIDLNRNVNEVLTLAEREKLKVPNDGFVYSFDGYKAQRISKNWNYKTVETVRFSNNSSFPIVGSYRQQNPVTISGYVEGQASGSDKVNAFLREVEASLGVTAGLSRTWFKGSTNVISFTVPANSAVYVTNYAVGINSNGSWRYRKYTNAGSWLGYYYEPAGGDVISHTDTNIELY